MLNDLRSEDTRRHFKFLAPYSPPPLRPFLSGVRLLNFDLEEISPRSDFFVSSAQFCHWIHCYKCTSKHRNFVSMVLFEVGLQSQWGLGVSEVFPWITELRSCVDVVLEGLKIISRWRWRWCLVDCCFVCLWLSFWWITFGRWACSEWRTVPNLWLCIWEIGLNYQSLLTSLWRETMAVSMKNVDVAFQGVGQKPYPFFMEETFNCFLRAIPS